MSLSGRTKNGLQVALADRIMGNELASTIDSMNWAVNQLQVAPGAAPTAAFAAALQAGDEVLAINHTSGATTFAAVTTAGTFPGLTITAGDLLIALRALPVGSKGLILPDADENTGIGYRDADAVNYVSAEPDHKKYPAT